RRPQELSTEECLDLVRQMARLGTREVTIIGGEAYLRRDWLEIIREIRACGMNCTLQTGGLHLTEKRIREAAAAGLQAVGVSIDGLSDLHDELRGVKGSFDAAFSALRHCRSHGIITSVNTQITALVLPQLRELMESFIEAGVKNWQVQLTVAMGRAVDHPEILLQPYELLELMPLLAELYQEGIERGLLMQPGNNIGYFGPYEALWRGAGDETIHWTSCNAGQNTIGIEADGTIKGCPSLPTNTYSGGNIRDLTLEDMWRNAPEITFARERTANDLWGYCRGCYYADVCRAGCTWTGHVLFGRAGNNPYCHHRALELSSRGLRERIVRVEEAPGEPFDHGRFELVLETEAGEPVSALSMSAAAKPVQITSSRKRKAGASKHAAPGFFEQLVICRGCNRHVTDGAVSCPHCGGNVKSLERAYQKSFRAAERAYDDLLGILGRSL
ncbi:MAG TPA: radical SAM protein, partial [Pyrinomonadaceae bacterium]|nr:radical SAM protein [Pyrinomonadaceae bacterium]